MNCFEILGIDSNSDKKTIKQAYAKLLKKYNPEDDSEGYQRLREAYDKAIKYEKSNKTDNNNTCNHNKKYEYINTKINESIIDSKSSNKELYNKSYDIHNSIDDYINNNYTQKLSNDDDNIDEKISIFYNRLNEIYCNLRLRTNKDEWKDLLNDDLLWNLDTVTYVKGIIISFICKHRFIPKEVMNQIDDILKICGNEISHSNSYNYKDINTYSYIYYNADTMSYKYMYDINPIYQDIYLELRLKINSIINNDKDKSLSSKIKLYFDQAVSIYDKDPEIYMMMANYYLQNNYTETALNMFKSILRIDSEYNEANKKAGEIYFYKLDFSHSLKCLESYINYHKDNITVYYMLAYCYYYTKQYEKALTYFKIIGTKYEYKRYIKKYINSSERKVKGKLSHTIKFNRDLFDRMTKDNDIIKNTTNKKPRKYSMIIYIIIFAVIFTRTVLINTNSNKNNTNYRTSKTYTKDGYKTISSLDDFKKATTNIKIAITLSDVEELDCYKLVTYKNSKAVEKKTSFMKKQEMIDKNYWEHAHGRIYSGKISGKRIFFECSKTLNMNFKKNTKYIIKGYASNITSDMFDSLSKFVNKPDNYISIKYISTSPTLYVPSINNKPLDKKTLFNKYKKNMDKINEELNKKKNHRN